MTVCPRCGADIEPPAVLSGLLLNPGHECQQLNPTQLQAALTRVAARLNKKGTK